MYKDIKHKFSFLLPKKSLLAPPVGAASDGLWVGEVRRIWPPTGGRDPVPVFAGLNVLVGAVWRWRCLSAAIMSPVSYPRPMV